MSEKALIWVSPNFKKMLKHLAADENKPVIQMTKDIANKHNEEEKEKKEYTWFGKGKRII